VKDHFDAIDQRLRVSLFTDWQSSVSRSLDKPLEEGQVFDADPIF